MAVKIKRRHLWTIAVATAATVLVVLLILIAAGALVVPGTSSPAPVSVTSVQFTILQGTNASGNPWFGPSTVVYTGLANGYPFTVSPGGGFSVPITFENYDSSPHTLYSISAAAPFSFAGQLSHSAPNAEGLPGRRVPHDHGDGALEPRCHARPLHHDQCPPAHVVRQRSGILRFPLPMERAGDRARVLPTEDRQSR